MQQATQHRFEKGAFVQYRADCGAPVEGIVRARHRDGTYTIEARHVLDGAGNRKPGYLGFRYRMYETDLRGRQ